MDPQHLDNELYLLAEAGDQFALEVKRQVDRINRAVEVLLEFGICPDCLGKHTSARLDFLLGDEFESDMRELAEELGESEAA